MTYQLETQLADHWNKPLAELPLRLRGLLRYIFRDTPWDTIKSKQRREIVAQWRGDIAIGMVGYNLVLQHDGPAPDLTNYLGLEAIDIGAFEALTDTAEGVHGDFAIAADSVHATPIDARTLSLLSRDDRRFMREFLKLRLALPCTPVQLVEFVDATEGAFSLPEGYAEQVRSRPVVADAAPAQDAEQESEQVAQSAQPVGKRTEATVRFKTHVHKFMYEVWNDYLLNKAREPTLPEPMKGEMCQSVLNKLKHAEIKGPRKKPTLIMVNGAAEDWEKPAAMKRAVVPSVEPPKRPVFKGAK